MFQVRRISLKATLPERADPGSAGYDLFAAHGATGPARGKGLLRTGWAMKMPSGQYGRFAPRSGLALKHFIDTGAGVIDQSYRGEC